MLQRAAVYRLERDPGAQLPLHEVTAALEHAVAEDDVSEITARLRAELERVVLRHQPAAPHRHVLGGARDPEGEAGLEHDGVVARLDRAVGDADVPAAVGVDPVGMAVLDGHGANIHFVAAQQADRVVAGIGHRDAVDPDPPALPEGDGLGALARAPIAVDAPGPDDGDALEPASLEEREREVARLAIGERLVAVVFRRVERAVVRARDEDGVALEPERHAAAQPKSPRRVLAGRHDNDAARAPASSIAA
jgi:hypothetical protein